MSQKRVLVIGAILVAAGIGAPTTAYLAPGGVLSEPGKPQVEAPAPAPAEPKEVSPGEVSPAGIAPRPPLPSGTTAVVPGGTTPPSLVRTPKPSHAGPQAQPDRPNKPRTSPTSGDGGAPPPPVQSDQPQDVPHATLPAGTCPTSKPSPGNVVPAWSH